MYVKRSLVDEHSDETFCLILYFQPMLKYPDDPPTHSQQPAQSPLLQSCDSASSK